MTTGPRILLDVSPLGLGFANPRMQAGIYRVVERSLAALPPTGLERFGLTSISSWILDRAAQEQLARLHPRLSPCWRPAHRRRGDDAWWAGLIAQARNGSRWSPARTGAALGLRMAGQLNRPTAIAGEWDTMHSFYDPLPGPERVPTRAQALTVHDLTILSHPGFHLPSSIATVTEAIGSIQHVRGWAACVSAYTRDELVRRTGFPPERTAVIHPGVDPVFSPATEAERAAVRERHGIGSRPYLLCLSSMEPRKNLIGALRGFARFSEGLGHRAPQLLLAGPAGWLNAGIVEELRRTRVPVRHLGFIPDPELPALYSGACGFLYPSHAEGFGLPVLEAMACGTPVLTSNTTSLPEVAGDAAVLIDPADVGAIAAGIGRLLQDGAEHSVRGRARAARFTWTNYRDGLLALHDRMAGG